MESRRDFFKKATLAGASMLAAPSLLADTLSDKKLPLRYVRQMA